MNTVTDDFTCSEEDLEPVTLLNTLFQQALSLQALNLTTLSETKALPRFVMIGADYIIKV